jgi:hypothetical protein
MLSHISNWKETKKKNLKRNGKMLLVVFPPCNGK